MPALIALICAFSFAFVAPASAWRTDFNGRGGPPPPSWVPEPCGYLASGQTAGYCPPANARVVGNGTLRLAASRSSGALLRSTRTFRAPFRLRARIRIPRATGYWSTIWITRTGFPRFNAFELDLEPRTGRPGIFACYQHRWRSYPTGVRKTSGDVARGRVDLARWHVWSITARRRGTTYAIDGRRCLSADPIFGTYQARIQNLGGRPGTWAAGCEPPPCGLPGARVPAETRVDFFEVRSLR